MLQTRRITSASVRWFPSRFGSSTRAVSAKSAYGRNVCIASCSRSGVPGRRAGSGRADARLELRPGVLPGLVGVGGQLDDLLPVDEVLLGDERGMQRVGDVARREPLGLVDAVQRRLVALVAEVVERVRL